MTFQVHTNVTTAQSKQYMNRQTNGVTSFHFKIGDIALKRNMRNIGRKVETGATMEWPIHVTILNIDLNLNLSSINLTNVSRVLLTFLK